MRKIKNPKGKKVICAMSGGTDSSVAAALLKRKGFNLIGVFMKFWASKEDGLIGRPNRCCSPEAEKRARRVASILGIPFYVLNFEKEFKKAVVDYFLEEYKKGRTPNPCVVCNKKIKFGLLLKKTLALEGDFVATGHYAQVNQIPNSSRTTAVPPQNHTGFTAQHWVHGKAAGSPKSRGAAGQSKFQIPKYKLYRGKDKNKDQSYFLWQLNQKQLKRILFPIGDYQMEEVEKLAKKMNLKVSKEKESQEICFIPKTINDFLKKHLKPEPGKIITSDEKEVGEHQGLHFYTIGQRRGIGLAQGPWYVLDKDVKNNTLIVTKDEKELMKKELVAEKANWIFSRRRLPLKVKVKIRYRSPLVSATIKERKKGKYRVVFDKEQRAITPGQSIVFYLPRGRKAAVRGKDQEVLGGAIITK